MNIDLHNSTSQPFEWPSPGPLIVKYLPHLDAAHVCFQSVFPWNHSPSLSGKLAIIVNVTSAQAVSVHVQTFMGAICIMFSMKLCHLLLKFSPHV